MLSKLTNKFIDHLDPYFINFIRFTKGFIKSFNANFTWASIIHINLIDILSLHK
jgi:hypothetical protein